MLQKNCFSQHFDYFTETYFIMQEHLSHEDREELNELMQQYENLNSGKQHTFLEEEAFERIIDYFDDINDHISKVLEALDESKETIEIYKDTDNMLNSEKTNKILSFLTILFTLSIPITVAGTFYGMNIVIPGSVNEGKNIFDYFPLILTVSLSSLAAIFMVIYFRKLGWFNS